MFFKRNLDIEQRKIQSKIHFKTCVRQVLKLSSLRSSATVTHEIYSFENFQGVANSGIEITEYDKR